MQMSAVRRRRSSAPARTSVRSPGRLFVPVEVARRLLLEPQAVVLRGLLEELGRLLEHVLLGAARRRRRERLVGGDLVAVLVEPRVLVVPGGLGGRRLLGDARLVLGQLVLR